MYRQYWMGLFCTVLFIFGSGCSQYEFGPQFTLRSKENRLTNSWAYSQVYKNGLNILGGSAGSSVIYSKSSIGLQNNGRFSTLVVGTDSAGVEETYNFDGSWRLVEDDAKLNLIFDTIVPYFGKEQLYTITKLGSDDLWYEQKEGLDLIEYRLIPN